MSSASSAPAIRTGTAPYGSAAQLLRRTPMGGTNVITGAGGALLEVGPELYNTLHIIDCRNKNINDVLRHLGQIP